jgi:hypothetical protein
MINTIYFYCPISLVLSSKFNPKMPRIDFSKDPSKMHHSFSYKDASKHNHKMASKYVSYQGADEVETFTIGNGWEKNLTPLTKKELMTIPWMKEAIEGTDAKLFINDCWGTAIKEVTDAGGIHNERGGLIRIAKNIKTPSRFVLIEYYRNAEGLWVPGYNPPWDIRSATVSANFGTLSDGFRVFSDGEKKYLYNKDGKERLAIPPAYDEYYCSCCYHDYDYEWD